MLHDQEAVVVLLQDGHELVDGKGAAHFQFREVAVQPIEDAEAGRVKSIWLTHSQVIAAFIQLLAKLRYELLSLRKRWDGFAHSALY